jgi:hypothetical protein
MPPLSSPSGQEKRDLGRYFPTLSNHLKHKLKMQSGTAGMGESGIGISPRHQYIAQLEQLSLIRDYFKSE